MSLNEFSSIMVIFGGTGDLTHRKLMPALYNLLFEKNLPENFCIVSVGRRDKTNESYRNEVYESIKNFSRIELDENVWKVLKNKIYYQKFDFHDDNGYTHLKGLLSELDDNYNTNGNRIFYLAVAPEYFELIVEKLNEHGMVENNRSWQRVMIEKPFGKDLNSAKYLNKKITEVFREKNTYRIDHYLGKEMLQNIMVIRFANVFFEPVWNNKYVDNIQISSSETVGIENRGGYYEKAGALRDMVQNHMLQLITLTAMEPPVDLSTESIHDEKVKVLKSLQELTPELVLKNAIRGQYKGYREEEKVKPNSDTETYVALKIYIENFRWAGVPFYIRTGKRLPVKSTEIIVQFKPLPGILFFKENGGLTPNLLVIKIQPEEGVFLQFNAKKPGTSNKIIPVQMDFCQNCQVGSNSPEAYERLIYDALRGDSTLFTRWDEVEYSWKYVDKIAEVWRNEKPNFPNYEAGTWGPIEADKLILKDNFKWWNIGGSNNENL
ncbi:glucose-6-phosphate dehydrogenase [Thermoanaerobacterium sp. RBIITD]|uniref:glucose-6-phosphate dehydrogenase n=1 Tax=Thermoanaerobacterium sp. RBIITD TaxID=1550240 RepID=UPI000BB753AD|nr:glucose-6-phosphate dehydrogenase [Thermoanaerobacterium sp. RBIITD]SNX52705.1 glucose-6-phosphate 1-dehydrogenase [Thermoanaerobacterium sp. RBIITD]